MEKNNWQKKFLKPQRIPFYLAIVVAVGAAILSFNNQLKTHEALAAIIALLTLLMVDGLIERMFILEEIERKIAHFPPKDSLRRRSEFIKIETRLKHAEEISVLVVSGSTFFRSIRGLLAERINRGAHLKVILLNPESPALEHWNQLSGWSDTEGDIRQTLKTLHILIEDCQDGRGSCEIRTVDFTIPYSMVGVDIHKDSGNITVEYYDYHEPVDKRPHVYLSEDDLPHWFHFYRDQFNKVWKIAKPYQKE